ncbi:MAG TPA: WG repeat-containing protein, partial [Bacteroidia bacterium]|nr:WG repeat-containing protein [Bacteroidia bacterium]
VVKPQFVNYIYFQKNLIRIVSEDGKKFGIINRKGELIIPVEYDAISDDYRAGYYLVCIKNGKKGVVDADGKLIIPAKFNDIRLLDDNYFVCEIDKKHQAVYSKTGEYINEVKAEYINIQSECIVFKTNDRYGFYHYKTNYFSPPKFSSVNGFYNDTGIAYVGGAACHIDTKGNYITHPRFNHVEIFSEGLSVVRSGGTYGFMNNKGDLITPVMYEHAQRFSEGLALVKLKGKYGFIDTAGKAVIDFIYSEAGPFGDGLAAVKVGNYWGFINQQGEMVIEPQFDSVTQPFAGGRTYVVKNNRMFIINPKGKEVSR